MTLSHSLLGNCPSFRYPADLFYLLPDVLTCFLRKHTYSYISENNFESRNQIIIPTGYICYITAEHSLMHGYGT